MGSQTTYAHSGFRAFGPLTTQIDPGAESLCRVGADLFRSSISNVVWMHRTYNVQSDTYLKYNDFLHRIASRRLEITPKSYPFPRKKKFMLTTKTPINVRHSAYSHPRVLTRVAHR
jgi:hypothetical protein